MAIEKAEWRSDNVDFVVCAVRKSDSVAVRLSEWVQGNDRNKFYLIEIS